MITLSRLVYIYKFYVFPIFNNFVKMYKCHLVGNYLFIYVFNVYACAFPTNYKMKKRKQHKKVTNFCFGKFFHSVGVVNIDIYYEGNENIYSCRKTEK